MTPPPIEKSEECPAISRIASPLPIEKSDGVIMPVREFKFFLIHFCYRRKINKKY